MAEELNSDSMRKGDIVFAKSAGYIPWPVKVIETESKHCLVHFLGTDDNRRILYPKIWLYNESNKIKFITSQNLKHEQFRDAVIIAETLLSNKIDDKEYNYRLIYKKDLPEEPGQKESDRKEASQEDAGHDEPGNEEGSQKEAGQEKTSRDKAGQGKSGQEKSDEEESGQGKSGQEKSDEEESDQEESEKEKSDQEESGQEKSDGEKPDQVESDQEKSNIEKSGQETSSEEESGQEKSSEEESSKEESDGELLGFKEAGHEENIFNAFENENTMIPEECVTSYMVSLRLERDFLKVEVEQKFLDLVNILRRSLKFSQKDYPSAFTALDELREMSFSGLLLVRNFEAVNSIFHLCYLNSTHLNYDEAAQVRYLAETLMSSFATAFRLQVTVRDFMTFFRTLSQVYREYTSHFYPRIRQCDLEETGQEETGQEETGQEETGQEETDQEETGQEETGQEETDQEETDQEETGQEETDQEEPDQEEPGQEETDQEETDQEQPGQEETGQEEHGQEAMSVEEPEHDYMIGEEPEQEAMAFEEPSPMDLEQEALTSVEKFDVQIYVLRSTLTSPWINYDAAIRALEKLLLMEFTKPFLMQKYMDVYLIYGLCTYGRVLPWHGLAKATQVRNLANKLMARFLEVFQLPGMTIYDFMVHYVSNRTSDSSDTESDDE